MEMKQRTTNIPHVMLLPFAAQGHIKPMMKLAELLNQAGSEITFVNTNHYHNHFKSYHSRSPKFSFTSIPDGLPPDHPRNIIDLLISFMVSAKQSIHQLLISLTQLPTCIIADELMTSAAIDVAEELGIPVIAFRAISASCLWTYFHVHKLVEQEQVPFPGYLTYM